MYTYKAFVLRIVDGDTVELNIDLGFKIWYKTTTRFYGVNTPELNSKDLTERQQAQAAKAYVAAQLPIGCEVLFESKELDKYGRPLGTITKVGEVKSINTMLLEENLAVPYLL
jgi:micrococcal nuclease